jgi:hypothetical protein
MKSERKQEVSSEDGKEMFLRNVGLFLTDYMALYPRRYTYSTISESSCFAPLIIK